MNALQEAQRGLIALYTEDVVESALESMSMIDGEYLKDVCLANIQDEIDFYDIEHQVKQQCEVVIRKEINKLLAKLDI